MYWWCTPAVPLLESDSFFSQKTLMLSLAQVIEDDLEDIAKLETIEMGRLYTAAKSGLQGTVNLIRRFADHFQEILADQSFESEWLRGHIQHDPLGVILVLHHGISLTIKYWERRSLRSWLAIRCYTNMQAMCPCVDKWSNNAFWRLVFLEVCIVIFCHSITDIIDLESYIGEMNQCHRWRVDR